jgi:hypothetical protein
VSDLTLEADEESCALGEDRVLIGLRYLSRKLEEFLALAMSISKEQTQQLRINAACGARDGRHKGDTMVVSIGILILKHFLLGGLPQWPVDVIRVAQLPVL